MGRNRQSDHSTARRITEVTASNSTIDRMKDVNVGIIGLGNVGSGTVTILRENAEQIALKLGFRLNITAVCSADLSEPVVKLVPETAMRTTNWREVVANPNVDVVTELIGGTKVARE